MKITFQTQTAQETEKSYLENRKATKTQRADGSYKAAFFAGAEDSFIQGQNTVGVKEKGKTLAELQLEAGNMDVAVQRDYMTVLSNTMSKEDYAKLSEEGFDFASMNPEEAVTIVDKIKAQLARSGQHVAGYTDDLSLDTLAAALGSSALANAVVDSFQEADIPLTQENLDNVARAWEMASGLEAPSEGVSHYMIDNQLEPEIWNLYLAKSSGAEKLSGSAPLYYAEEIQGYYTQTAIGDMEEGLQGQIDKVIAQAGLSKESESHQWAEWLMDKKLPLTAENLLKVKELQEIIFPVEEEVFAKAAVAAIAEGKLPIYANLARTENIYEKAIVLAENYYTEKLAELDNSDITARRQLEEIRLRMTAEVNVKLLKSGFSIDTAPMEELVKALKAAEEQLAQSYFPQDELALDKYYLYQQTNQVARELPTMPVELIGSFSMKEGDSTIAAFHAEGKALKESYIRAQASYETLMTAPRRDMGDSIKKAFANVDVILEDLGLEQSLANQRAVRILGYNSMELTIENIERVQAVDEQVCSIIEKMTPQATLKMIRDGVNPLEMNFEQLEDYFANQPESYEENAESYSRFLYHLEQSKEITPEEREAYIGVYRLLRQIEKSDGAVIGAVINSNMEQQFGNLLTAIRSNRFAHMDKKVTDETGLMKELVREGNSISEQIANGIAHAARQIVTELSSDVAIENQYRESQLVTIRQTAYVTQEAKALLEAGEMAVNSDNLLAAQALAAGASSPYKELKSKTKEPDTKADQEHIFKELSDLERLSNEQEFEEGYTERVLELAKQAGEMSLTTMEGSLNVKQMQLLHKQLTITASMARSREYVLPMYIGEELGKVHLKLVNDKEQRGTISIKVDLAKESHIEAHLQVTGTKISGYLIGNTEEEVTKLKEISDIFHNLLKEDTSTRWELGALPVVGGNVRTAFVDTMQEGVPRMTELYQVARRFLQAVKA
ncbi:MAG: hypothetical protein IJF07_08880 [Lachnospiraceae bacterium]|nr:hypothetical protein [Lachnospiraceae bacterium]